MERTCEQCGAKIPPQKGSARPRKFCATCRPPRNRPNPRVIKTPRTDEGQEASAAPVDLPTGRKPGRPGLVETYRRQLEAAERLETPEGAHVLLLAELLAGDGHTAAGAASLSRELRAAMEEAMKGAPPLADRLDELAARRAQKAAGA